MGDSDKLDVCTDCGRVLPGDRLFRCGRWLDGEAVKIQICIDCLYAVNPHLQRDLIESAGLTRRSV